MPHDRFKRSKDVDRYIAAVPERYEEGIATRQCADRAQNAMTRDWLGGLAAQEGLPHAWVELIHEWVKYLTEHPTKRAPPLMQRCGHVWSIKLKMGVSFDDMLVTPRMTPAGWRAHQEECDRRHAARRRKDREPWENDPGLLPKRPPPRKVEDNE